jgi:hypothetical protein
MWSSTAVMTASPAGALVVGSAVVDGGAVVVAVGWVVGALVGAAVVGVTVADGVGRGW